VEKHSAQQKYRVLTEQLYQYRYLNCTTTGIRVPTVKLLFTNLSFVFASEFRLLLNPDRALIQYYHYRYLTKRND
jgi:hypothetical protein